MREDTIKTPWEVLHENINSLPEKKPTKKSSYFYSVLPLLLVTILFAGFAIVIKLLVVFAAILALRLNKNL